MGTSVRQQREYQQRERLIVHLARHLLLEHDYRGLNMDRIAAAAEYSKGTIYQHFTCKEDVLAGVVLEALDDRLRLVERASHFPGRTRERVLALALGDELFHRLHPDYLKAQQIVRVSSLLAKIDRRRRRAIRIAHEKILRIVDRLIREAIDQGDLKPSLRVTEITFALWSLVHGIRAVGAMPLEMRLLGLNDAHGPARRVGEIMLDGLGWKPLSTEWDYQVTQARIAAEVFPDLRELLGAADPDGIQV